MGLLPLTFILRGSPTSTTSSWNLHPDDLIWCGKTAAALVLFPLVVAIRAQAKDGHWRKRPSRSSRPCRALVAIAGFTAPDLTVPGYFSAAA
jgi:hypothetical protein